MERQRAGQESWLSSLMTTKDPPLERANVVLLSMTIINLGDRMTGKTRGISHLFNVNLGDLLPNQRRYVEIYGGHYSEDQLCSLEVVL